MRRSSKNLAKHSLYALHPSRREEGSVIVPTDPDRRVPVGYHRVPEYLEKMNEVRVGSREPFWGDAYTFHGADRPPDFVRASFFQFGVSEALKSLLIEAGAKGLRFHPIRVDGLPMSLLGVKGQTGVQPAPMELRLLDGAEVGLYGETEVYVSARIATLIRKAGLQVCLEPPFIVPEYPGPSYP